MVSLKLETSCGKTFMKFGLPTSLLLTSLHYFITEDEIKPLKNFILRERNLNVPVGGFACLELMVLMVLTLPTQ